MRVEQGVAWVDLPDNEFRSATPGECAARIAELEAAMRRMHATVPGGNLADPQRIADELREIAARVGVDVGN